MGFAISWIAFKGKSKEEALVVLGLSDSGEIDEAVESPMAGASLPTGWYVVSFSDYDFVTPDRLARFSAGCDLVGCQVEEHVMASTTYIFKNGRELFSVHHQGDEEIYSLAARGDPPATYANLRDRLIKEQDTAGGRKADVDHIFDIPVQLAAELCGYRHDMMTFDGGEPRFTRLEPAFSL